MKRILFLLLFLFHTLLNLYGQEQHNTKTNNLKIDSLKNLYEQSLVRPDRFLKTYQVLQEAYLLKEIALLYLKENNYKTSINYLEKSKIIYTEKQIYDSLMFVYDRIMYNYFRLGDYDNVIIEGEKGISLFKTMSNIQLKNSLSIFLYKGIAYAFKKKANYNKALMYYDTIQQNKFLSKLLFIEINNNIGIIYKQQGKYKKALEYYFLSLKISDSLKNTLSKASILNNIGIIYKKQEDYINALRYFNLSLEIRKKDNKSSHKLALAYMNIANIYKTDKINNLTEALIYEHKALKIGEQFKINDIIASAYLNIGATQIEIEQYDSAYFYLNKSLKLYQNLENKHKISRVYLSLGYYFFFKQEYKKALNHVKQCYQISEEIQSPANILDCANLFSKIYNARHQYKDAYLYHKEYISIRDSLKNKDNVRKIAQLEMQYDFDKEKLQKELSHQLAIEKEKLKTSISIIGTIIMIIFASFIYRNYKQKQRLNQALLTKNKEVNEQKEKISKQAETLKTTNKELINLDNFKQNMVSMIVHDLKNPLNTVIGFSTQELKQQNNRKINQSGKQMLNMVQTLLDVNKFTETKIEIKTEHYSVKNLFRHAVENVDLLIEDKNLTIKKEIDNSLFVHIDIDLTQRLIENLLTNAIKYSNNNSEIILKAQLHNENVRIAIKDYGYGIPKEKLETIFEKFTQVNAKKLGVSSSTGLGLTFCKIVAEAHGGNIGVISEKDEGSEFWIILPKGEGEIIEEINHEETQEKRKILLLSQENQIALQEAIEKLNTLEIFEASEIINTLNNIKLTNNDIQTWKEEIENTVYTCNEEKYIELIKFKV